MKIKPAETQLAQKTEPTREILCTASSLRVIMAERNQPEQSSYQIGFLSTTAWRIYFPEPNVLAKWCLSPLESLWTGRAKWGQLKGDKKSSCGCDLGRHTSAPPRTWAFSSVSVVVVNKGLARSFNQIKSDAFWLIKWRYPHFWDCR